MDIHALEKQLSELPHQIRQSQIEVIQAREVVERAKLLLNVSLAKATLEATGENAQAKKASATIRTVCEQEELIKAQIEYDRKEAEFLYVSNRFVSLRKIASLENEMLKSQVQGF